MKEFSHAEVASYFPIETTFFNFSEGVDVMPNSTVEHVSFSDGQINLRLNTGNEVRNVLSPPLRRGGGGNFQCRLGWVPKTRILVSIS